MRILASRVVIRSLYAAALFVWTSPAYAQFHPRPVSEAQTAEDFHIESSVSIWLPSADAVIASESFGIPGTSVDFKKDLGLKDQSFPEFKITAKLGRNHKLRMNVIPMSYTASTTLTRDIIFNGQRYSFSVPVNSSLDWTQWRFNYEFDFVAKSRGFAGLILEAKYNDISAHLTALSPKIDEFTEARAPLPALGGIGRFYIVPSVSITGELVGLKIPDSSSRYHGNWTDIDIYGTANFMKNIGAQFGFRVVDLAYTIKEDSGSLTLKGIYFGVVARY